MITLSTFEIVSLAIAIGLGMLNIIQFQRQLRIEKERFKPIYNGLIGIYNHVNNKVSYYYWDK